MWPFNRGWPLNGGPLNRGSTVYTEFANFTELYIFFILQQFATSLCSFTQTLFLAVEQDFVLLALVKS